MIKLELTEQKAQALVELLDIATKSGGIQVAKMAVILVDDILNAVKESQKESGEPSGE